MSTELRAAVTGQWAAVQEMVDGLDDDAFDRPTRLGDWRVRELVAHLAGNPTHLQRMLAESPQAARLDAMSYYDGSDERAAAVAARAAEFAAGRTPAQLRAAVAAATEQAGALLRELPANTVLAAPHGGIRLADYLPSRCVEGCVHALDLAAATGAGLRLDPAAVGVAVRLLTSMLARRAPGHTVEVRVPPHAAVQVVAGPRHRRGTPPNVVEVAPEPWLELATGRLSWSAALAGGQVSVSGARADLSGLLPLLG